MKTDNRILSGCLCALGCEVIFGFSYMFTKQATAEASSIELLCWRFFIAIVVISVCRMFGLIKVQLKGKPVRKLLLVSLFCPLLYFIGETIGISHTSASESGVFLACIPVASLIASALILKKKPTRFQSLGIGITLIGVIITVFAAGMSASLSPIGYLFLVIAVISYALYSVSVEKAAEFSEAEISFVMLAVGAIVYIVIAVIQALVSGDLLHLVTLPVHNTAFLSAVLYQGIGCSVLAFFLSNTAISRIGVNRTASFVGASTVISILAGCLILNESLSLIQIIGAVIIIAGIYTANAKK